MTSFTTTERTQVYERVLEIAKADARVTGGAIVGSFASNKEDELSDIDITFGIKTEIKPPFVPRGVAFASPAQQGTRTPPFSFGTFRPLCGGRKAGITAIPSDLLD